MKQKVDSLLKDNPLVVAYKTEYNNLSRSIFYVRDEALFVEMNKLFFFALWGNKKKEKYRYQYQNEKDELIFRYDNTPHFKKLETFPHHKHLSSGVIKTNIVTLQNIINKIKEIILYKLAR